MGPSICREMCNRTVLKILCLRSLTASINSCASEQRTKAVHDPALSELTHRWSEQSLCDLLLSKEGFVFRPRDSLGKSPLKSPILKSQMQEQYEMLVNRQLKAVGRTLYGDPEPNETPSISRLWLGPFDSRCRSDFLRKGHRTKTLPLEPAMPFDKGSGPDSTGRVQFDQGYRRWYMWKAIPEALAVEIEGSIARRIFQRRCYP
jgi:hypothetical protein